MSALPLKTAISDTYPLPSNATARTGFGALWDAVNECTEKSELDIASAATCSIGAALSTKLRVTGTTTITSFGTTYRGPIVLRFSGAVTLTYNATTLLIPGAANYTTVAGDLILAWPKAAVSGTLDGWQISILSGVIPKVNMPTGSVLQVVQGTTSTLTSISSTTYTDTTLTASITPTSATSKILVLVTQQTWLSRAGNACAGGIRIMRDSTAIYSPVEGAAGASPDTFGIGVGGATSTSLEQMITLSYRDSPATTSTLQYKTQGAILSATSSALIEFQSAGSGGGANGTSTIILMEIAA